MQFKVVVMRGTVTHSLTVAARIKTFNLTNQNLTDAEALLWYRLRRKQLLAKHKGKITMKKIFLLFLLCALQQQVFAAADLLQVFRQALVSDPTYKQAISQRLSTREGVPINLAGLLPSLSAGLAYPNYTKYASSGPASGHLSGTERGYNLNLNLTQTVFDFGKFAGLASARDLAKGADATLSAATQNLMIRVAQAYFNILRDQDNLVYIKSTRTAYAKQLDQVTQQYRVGLKTITEVYTARASYE